MYSFAETPAVDIFAFCSSRGDKKRDWAFGPWILYSNSVLIHTLNSAIQVPYETLRAELMEVQRALELP